LHLDFEFTPKYYLDYIKNAKEADLADFKSSAMTKVLSHSNLSEQMVFLEAVQEYQVLEDTLLSNLHQLREYEYSYYRKLSKVLAANGRYLGATMLRRYLVNSILIKATSKYYDYAVSDLKLAIEYGAQVVDWKNIPDSGHYVKNLQDTHKKKYSFWDRIQFIK